MTTRPRYGRPSRMPCGAGVCGSHALRVGLGSKPRTQGSREGESTISLWCHFAEWPDGSNIR